MRQWASGVCVVTSSDESRRHGMTVTSFASLALEPPLILVSLENTTRTNSMVRQSGKFAVAILSEEQQELSDIFAGRLSDDDNRFEGIPYFDTKLGCPIPEGSLAYMDCQVESSHPAGTHTIFIGQVEAGEVLKDGPPLLYHNQNYGSLQGPQ
jgi:flavin reductase (DIM6/NTAB) family NADH-FMN oxidoreductase RutF